ncbi:MAG: protoporphyrinogen/coproporphyrinogen oxidase [Acidobacteriota bacterium]|jgi:oxygen-dependent protoporphyrinogen oxidase|nr:protoporphyrinogen/coproporphyrinogen oxidase [Acidobacteriota bacterium]
MSEGFSKRRRIVIVGAGISGLAAAHRLFELQAQDSSAKTVESQTEILLLEASDRTGGTVRTYRREGFLLEGGPDSFISEKTAALELARRIGLADRIIETNEHNRRSFVVRGGRLRPTPEGFQLLAPSRMLPFLMTDIFTWRGKARMALDLVLPRRKGANGLDDESLAAFVRRRFGQEALERMAQPMMGGIYTADPEHLSLRATKPLFLDMERRQRSLILAMWKAGRSAKAEARHGRAASGARYSLFLTFDEGTQVLTDALAARLPAGVLRLNTRVESLTLDIASPAPEGETRRWLLKTEGGETISADAVCLALPAYASARLLRSTDDGLADELDSIPYASTATVNMAFRRADIPHPLDGFGFVVPFIERRTALACTFSSIKFAGRAPEGQVLLRAFVGGALQPEMFDLDEDAMVEAVRRDLRDLLGVTAAPRFAHVEKWPRSMPQYHLGHIERLSRIDSLLQNFPTLRLCGNAFDGTGLPDCVRGGEAAADDIFNNRLLPLHDGV